jgi:hypothetical protein
MPIETEMTDRCHHNAPYKIMFIWEEDIRSNHNCWSLTVNVLGALLGICFQTSNGL